ncbi:SIR2 family protein [Bacillus sp. RIT694]|uniref:SIR2 family protein n=1 Tax=Bacillus sp. RIT694 TaxID=2666190 RepID=UPI0012ACC74D|nr:SIR2 family protein [Bacillus sp. RIT694]MRS25598.1 hypothetical protein [Bacillus sp. RIT694]
MAINWPDNLIEEIAYRRCVIFIGAGISATSINQQGERPKKWGEFIKGAKSLIPLNKIETIAFVEKMIQQENYLLGLQAIVDAADSGQYANYLQQIYSRPNYQASVVHENIKEIDSKIVISTNFDKIYENICNDHGYTIANYTESKKIVSNIKSTNNLIIKAHGTIDDTDLMVFTQQEYYKAKQKHPEFYEILNALFHTHTFVFLGYSLKDPDINLILESVSKTSPTSSPHYVIVKEGVEQEIKNHWRNCYNISTLEYGPDYENMEDEIIALNEKVWEYRGSKKLP